MGSAQVLCAPFLLEPLLSINKATPRGSTQDGPWTLGTRGVIYISGIVPDERDRDLARSDLGFLRQFVMGSEFVGWVGS
jgi:hypothetical protein